MNHNLQHYASYARGLTNIAGSVGELEACVTAGMCDETDRLQLADMETELAALLARVQALKATANS